MEIKKGVLRQLRELKERYDKEGQYYEVCIKYKGSDIVYLPLTTCFNYLGNGFTTLLAPLEDDYTIVLYRNNAPILYVTNKTEVK